MKRSYRIVLIVLLFAVGTTAGVLILGRGYLQRTVMRDVLHGVDTFCIPLYSPRAVLPGDAITAEGPRRDAFIAARVVDAASRLTDYGWEHVDFDDGACLTGGRFSLTVERVSLEWIVLPSTLQPHLVLFVTLRAQTSEPKLAAWAQNPAIHGAFQEIATMLGGAHFRVGFLRQGLRWRAVPEKELPFRVPEGVEIVAELEAEGAKSPLPDKAALREFTLKEYGNWSAARACIDIAGTGDYPVDETVLDDRNRMRFAVAIYEMLERDPVQRRVLTVTLPRIEALERAGVLRSSATRGPKYRAQLPGRLYELTPDYDRFLLRPFPYPPCLYAGQNETAVTAMKTRGVQAKMVVRDRYLRIEPWASAPEIREAMPDLRKATDFGALCMHELILKEKKWDWGASGTCR